MLIYTIGFTEKSAERFFTLISANAIKRVIDVRVHPHGQLAGFSKQRDLQYFLRELCNCEYAHLLALAPEAEMMKEYRKSHDWNRLCESFIVLMDERNIPGSLDRTLFDDGPVCLLCSEAMPETCHRTLVAERLARDWSGVEIRHLV
jgi:uncharacterized protein (DUF488 family)